MDRQSSSESEARRPKKSRKMGKEKCLKELLKLQNELVSVHKTPCLFVIETKHGIMQFGSNNVIEKFKMDYGNDINWKEAFEKDDEEILGGMQHPEVNDDINSARAAMIPSKLPANLHLMNYEELWRAITEETLKEHWASGGKYKCVKFGNASFEPSFWLSEIWPWSEVDRHPNNLKKSAYSGPGQMTDFLRKVVQKLLEKYGINHEEWVDEKFSDEKKKKRERARNKSTQEGLERLFENDSEVLNHNYENVEPDVVSTDDAVNENIEEPLGKSQKHL